MIFPAADETSIEYKRRHLQISRIYADSIHMGPICEHLRHLRIKYIPIWVSSVYICG